MEMIPISRPQEEKKAEGEVVNETRQEIVELSEIELSTEEIETLESLEEGKSLMSSEIPELMDKIVGTINRKDLNATCIHRGHDGNMAVYQTGEDSRHYYKTPILLEENSLKIGETEETRSITPKTKKEDQQREDKLEQLRRKIAS